eukprot:COSAG01_NODE_57560_length_311_cov_1.212264_1_plen_98_part_10
MADLEDGSRNALDTVDIRAALGFGPLGMDGEEIAGTETEQQDLSMEALEVHMEHAEPELATVQAMNQALQVALHRKNLWQYRTLVQKGCTHRPEYSPC